MLVVHHSHAYGYNALGQRAFKPRFQTVAPGDADGDGVIDQNDLLALRDMIKGEIPASPGADCNSDGAIDNQDTHCIARQIGATKSQGKGKNSDTETETVTTAATNGALTQVGWILFAYDEAGRLIGEYDETGEPIRRYVWLEDLPLAVISTEGIHYLHADHLNTPKAVTDPSGAVVWQADYRPFGAVTELVDTLEMNLRFPGQYRDRETGLHQNWHREYVPELGRYSQSDPIGLGDGPNTYAYAGSNPLAFKDLNGLARVCCRILDWPYAGSTLRQQHCYVRADDGNTYGLYPDPFRFRGIPVRNDDRDRGGVCFNCPARKCENQNVCLARAHTSYPVGRYNPLGPNSNTYAGALARDCCADGVPELLFNAHGIDDRPPHI